MQSRHVNKAMLYQIKISANQHRYKNYLRFVKAIRHVKSLKTWSDFDSQLQWKTTMKYWNEIDTWIGRFWVIIKRVAHMITLGIAYESAIEGWKINWAQGTKVPRLNRGSSRG